MVIAMNPELPDYNELLTTFQSRMGESGLIASTAEQIAEQIYEATTDGKTQLRYLLGEDAKQLYAMREAQGDDAFIAGMKQRTLD